MFEKKYNDITIEINNKIQKMIEDLIINTNENLSNMSTCSTTSYRDSFTNEKLMEVIEKVKPYHQILHNLYSYAIPAYEYRFDKEDKNQKPMFDLFQKYAYGFPVTIPMRTIKIKVQVRTHRQKRINKKWSKRYGYKEVDQQVPDYGLVITGV